MHSNKVYMPEIDLSQFVDKFKDDSNSLLNELEGQLLELERDASNQELIESIFRTMHTMKGFGRMFSYQSISEYTHLLEGIYDNIREARLKLNRDIFNITFDSIDHLRNLLNDQFLENPSIAFYHQILMMKIQRILKNPVPITK